MQAWHNLDEIEAFDSSFKSVQSLSARNFAVKFNANEAFCGLDLEPHDIDALLQQSSVPHTRWINFWSGESDAKAIKIITKSYGVSPRLAALLCSPRATPSGHDHAKATNPPPAETGRKIGPPSPLSDVEKGSGHSDTATKASVSSTRIPGFGELVDDLWHFCSVDRGSQYLYVGFNALYTAAGETIKQDSNSVTPAGIRIWTSFLLCHDGTVVSIFERPPADTSAEHIMRIRSNALNIFRHLSRLHRMTSMDTLMQITVRPTRSDGIATATEAESSALLFYYLFDDWRTTFDLITRRSHPYRDRLESIRQEMYDTANMDLIKSLDLVGRQLTVLKLLYQSYELTIRRILRPWNLHDARGAGGEQEHDYGQLDTQCLGHETYENDTGFVRSPVTPCRHREIPGVLLPMSVVVRFERLLDRVRLYALTEIDECIKQKDSLVFMNFNLVTLKESQAIEKLTRITIVLAKATMLFLPVSLMTAYFSVQIADIENLYSLTTYWVCFLVVVLLSIIGLVIFSITTEKIGGKTTYKSLTRTFSERLQKGKMKRP